MIRTTLPLALLLFAACSDRQAGTDGSESDFASRVGAGPAATATATPMPTTAVRAAPPAGSSPLDMEKLGDISGVDLGPRAGGCTFSDAGKEILVAAGPADRALPGKAAVRIGGRLLTLDTPPGGIAAIKAGTKFTGEGFTVAVQPTGPGRALLSVTDAKGARKLINGEWVCA